MRGRSSFARSTAVGAAALTVACSGSTSRTDSVASAADTAVAAAEVDSARAPGREPSVRSCSAEARPGVVVVVDDARTAAPLSGYTLQLWRDVPNERSRLDSITMTAPPPAVWAGALEQSGRFALRVSKPGYRTWDSAGIVVARDSCHVQGVTVRARLVAR